MRYAQVPQSVIRDLNESFESTREASKFIEQSTPSEVFEKYLTWNGIIGYSSLYDVANELGRERVIQTMHPYFPDNQSGITERINKAIKIEVSHDLHPKRYSFFVTMKREGVEEKRQGFFELDNALRFANSICEECGK